MRNSPHQFRTIVRDGPIGTPEGLEERYVVIAKRSFRGAGPWRMRGEIIVIHGRSEAGPGVEKQNKMNDQREDHEMLDADGDVDDTEQDESEDENGNGNEDEDEDGEVEIMWDVDGSRYQLMRDPPMESDELRRETHWVNTQYFSR